MFLWAGGQDDGKTAVEEKITLHYLTWYPPQAVMNEITGSFEKKYPNVHVEATIIGGQDYLQKVPVALASGEDIDLLGFNIMFANDLKGYVFEADPLLTKHMGADWESKFSKKANDSTKSLADDGKLYGVPIGSLGSPVVFYNASMFDQFGLTVPKTTSELESIIKTIRAADSSIMPVAFRGKLYHLHSMSAVALWGQRENLWQPLAAKEMRFDSPEVKDVTRWWKSLFDQDIISRDNLDVDNSIIAEIFFTGKAAMMIHGTWMAGLLSEEWREKNKVEFTEAGAFLFPGPDPGKAPTFATAPDMHLAVVKTTKHEQAAANLMIHIIYEEGLDIIANQFLLFPSKVGYIMDETKLKSDVARKGYETLKKGMDNPNNPMRFPNPILQEYGKVLQSIILGADIDKACADFQEQVDTGKYD
jgi:raffinose/stachyose/melibiose transport system substrate-binding protein